MSKLFVSILLFFVLSIPAFTATVSLSVTPGNTLVQGSPFKFTATPSVASTAWRYKYLYYMYDKTLATYVWVVLSAWSINPTFTWTPTTAQAGNNIKVAVYMVNSTDLMSEQLPNKTASAITTISVRPKLSKVNLSILPATSAALGSTVQLSANTVNGTVTTGAVVKYRFRYNDGNGWNTIQDYSLNSSATWQPDVTGTYFVEVCAKEYSAIPVPTSDYDVRYQLIYKIIPGATKVTTTLSKNTISLSDSVSVYANTDVNNAEYYYLYSTDGAIWNSIQNYSALNIAVWTPAATGDYLIKTRVRSKGNLADYEAESAAVALHVDTKGLAGINITANPVGSVLLNKTVTFTGVSLGGINTEYRLSIKAADGTVVYSVAYQNTGDFNWLPAAKGFYAVTIDCREVGSAKDFEYTKVINYEVKEDVNNLVIGDFIAAPESPMSFTNGMSIVLTASMKTGLNPEYKFTYTDTTGENIIRDYDIASSTTWKPTKIGNYSLKVYVRAFGNDTVTPVNKSISYILTDNATPPDITNVVLSVTENPPYIINNAINFSASATGGKSVEYKFVYRCQSDGFVNETILKLYDLFTTVKFTPVKADNYRIYVYARETGSTDPFKVFAFKDITVANDVTKPANVKVAQISKGVLITWDLMPNCYKLTVRRRVYGGRDWNIIKPDSSIIPATPADTYIASSESSYLDGFIPSSRTTYEYQVGNLDKLSGNITWSDSVYLSTGLTWGDVSNSAAITFTAQAASQDTINVSWPLFTGVDGYNLEYSTDGLIWIPLSQNIATSVTSYSHTYTNPSANQLPKLTYRIQAFQNLVNSSGVLTKVYSNWLVSYEAASIVFTWTDVGSGITGFDLQYSIDDAVWVNLVSGLAPALRTYTYTPTILLVPANSYRVVAYINTTDANGATIKAYKYTVTTDLNNNINKSFLNSVYKSIVNNNYLYKYESVYPVVPSITFIVTTGATIQLNWATQSYAQFFEINRSDMGTTNWFTTGQSYKDGVKNVLTNYPTTYQYKIRAGNEYHVSDWSTISSPVCITPIKPSWIVGTPLNTSNEIRWYCPSAYYFDVYRNGVNVATTTENYYIDNTVGAGGTSIQYYVRARPISTLANYLTNYLSYTLASINSDPITVTRGYASNNLNFRLSSVANNNINLAWDLYPGDVAATPSNYEVEKWSAASPAWAQIAAVTTTAVKQDTSCTITVSDNPYANVYFYRLRGKINGATNFSNWDIVRVYNANVDNTKVVAVDNKDLTVSLTWPQVPGASEYRICRHKVSGSNQGWTYIDTNSILPSYIDGVDTVNYPALEWGAEYYYHFVAIYDANTEGNFPPAGANFPCSTYTTRDSADLDFYMIPDKPVINSITVTAGNTAQLSVTLPAHTDRYNVERLIGTTWQKVNQNALTATTYSDTTVPPNSNTQYRIIAYLSTNPANLVTPTALSPYSDPVSFINLSSHPTTFTAIVVNDTSVKLDFSFPATFAAWFTPNPYPNPSSYEIVYCVGAVANWGAPTGIIPVAGNLNTYTQTGLTPESTYWYRIYAYNNAAVPVRSVAFNVSTPASVVTLPIPPVLSLVSVDAHNVNLSWTYSPITAASSYNLEVDKYDGAGWVSLASPVAGLLTYTDSNMLPLSYRNYRLRAVSIGAKAYTTLWSNTIITQTRDLPSTPVLALTVVNDSTIRLTWTRIFSPVAVECIYKYKIKKDTDNLFPGWVQINAPVDIGNNQYTFDITGLSASVKYQICMQAVDADGNPSADSAIVSATTLTSKPLALSLVSKSFNSIKVKWTASTGATSYTININPGLDISNINAGLTEYDITNLADNSTFAIKIKALSDVGVSDWSDVLNESTTPIAPTLTVAKVDNTTVLLAWNENYNPIVTYNIERLSADGTVKSFTALTSGVNDDVTSAVAGVSYKYRVNVQTAIGTSPWSSYVVYALNPDIPALTFKSLSQTSIQISWDPIANAQSYELQRKSGSAWIKIASFSPSTDINLSTSTIYSYRIQSIGKNGTASGWSSTSDWATKTATPTGFAAVVDSNGKIALSWNNVSGETGYSIQKSTDAKTWSGLLPDSGADVTSLLDPAIIFGNKYYYRIASFNAYSVSDYSTAVSVNPVDAPALTVTAVSSTSINISWTNVTGETGYELQRQTGLTWTTIKTT